MTIAKDSKIAVAIAILVLAFSTPISMGQSSRERPEQIEQELKNDIPHLICLDPNVATAGQPTDNAYAKLAAKGYRTVLSLRTASEGPSVEREKDLVEKSGMRYVNIPVVGSDPRPEQADAFIAVVKDQANYPMLIHCGSANRVGGFWMIYRVVVQGWPEDKASEEATRIGLSSPVIKKFATDYISSHKK